MLKQHPSPKPSLRLHANPPSTLPQGESEDHYFHSRFPFPHRAPSVIAALNR